MPAPMQDNFFQLASSVQGNSGIYLAAKLGGCDVKLLIDTGAQVSIIPKQRWLTITNGGAHLERHEGVVRVANGGRMLILGRWQTVCQFDSLTLITEFLVADLEPQEILLGSDFLLKYGAIINLDQKSCRVMGKQIPLLFGNNGMQPCDVMVHVDTPVPPRSEVLIVGAVEGTSDSFQGMLEPSSSLYNHCDLLVARVVCRVEQGILPIRVINVTDDTHILKRGMKVGRPGLQSVGGDRMAAVAGERSALHPDSALLADPVLHPDSALLADPALHPDSALLADPALHPDSALLADPVLHSGRVLKAVMPSVSTLLPAPAVEVAVPRESVVRESRSGTTNGFTEGRGSRARKIPARLMDYDLSA
ncbi:uncharacterized protein LOC120464304 [Pimephales promelas]|uniref:uncharacterized protein LOC120464304 n=1 Tax=Pimephales promelas TaxID=90988 RepID=UPI00195577A3|nr:uncharacterized protein LOC120464304 [Pimephales promelas]